jgi:DNA-binding CsgD family transcriptional regulator
MQKRNSGDSFRPYTILFDTSIHIARDRVALRLLEHSSERVTLERGIYRSDGTALIQVHAIDNQDSLLQCASSDLHYEHLRAQYHSIQYICSERRFDSSRDCLTSPSGVIDAIGRVQACADEGELMALMKDIFRQLGIASYVYRWVLADRRARDFREQRCLLGCHPGWTHAHSRHPWHGSDALLDYARRSAAPAVGSEIERYTHTTSPQLMHANCGFRSVLVCAAHSPTTSLFGMLQVGNDQMPPQGEDTLWTHRVLIRAITEEILDWRVAAIRKAATQAMDLDSRELAVLRLLHNGRTACNVADNLGVSQRTVYLIFQRINQKLGASHIARSLEKATVNGLLE